MPSKIKATVEPEKGTEPVAISYSTTPSENRSDRRSSSSPRACSGDIYATVPMELPGLVSRASSATRVCVRREASVRVSVASSRGFASFAKPKSKNFGGSVIYEKNIRGLDVPVDDALGVGSFKAIGNLDADVQEFRYFYGLVANALLERLALEQFHGDKWSAFEFSNIVNRADVRMVESRCGSRFAPKSLNGLGILRNVVGKELESNITAQSSVLGFVDHAHATAA